MVQIDSICKCDSNHTIYKKNLVVNKITNDNFTILNMQV